MRFKVSERPSLPKIIKNVIKRGFANIFDLCNTLYYIWCFSYKQSSTWSLDKTDTLPGETLSSMVSSLGYEGVGLLGGEQVGRYFLLTPPTLLWASSGVSAPPPPLTAVYTHTHTHRCSTHTSNIQRQTEMFWCSCKCFKPVISAQTARWLHNTLLYRCMCVEAM